MIKPRATDAANGGTHPGTRKPLNVPPSIRCKRQRARLTSTKIARVRTLAVTSKSRNGNRRAEVIVGLVHDQPMRPSSRLFQRQDLRHQTFEQASSCIKVCPPSALVSSVVVCCERAKIHPRFQTRRPLGRKLLTHSVGLCAGS